MLVVSSPVVAACATRAFESRGIPTGDIAITAAASRHATTFAQTLGPYSRFGFAHPGPASFYVFAPFTGGDGDVSLLYLATGALWTACAAALVLALGGRTRPLAELVMAAIFAAYACTMTSVHFLDIAVVHPWNPLVAVAATFGLVGSAAFVARGSTRALIPLVLTFSLAGQSHVTLVPIAFAVMGATFPAVANLWRTNGGASAARLRIGASVVLLLFAFAPVVFEAASNRGGNVLAILHAVRDGVPGTKAFLDVERILFMLAAPTLGVLGACGMEVDRFSNIPTTITLGALAVVSVHAVRGQFSASNEDVRPRVLAMLTLASAVGALATLPFLRGHANVHPYYPMGIVGVLLHACALVPFATAADRSARRGAFWCGVALVVPLCAGLAYHEVQLTLARRDALRTAWPPVRLMHSVAEVARCLAIQGPFSLRIEGKSGWVPAATAAWIGVAKGRAPRLSPEVRPVFGQAFSYGSVAPTRERPTLVIGTRPFHLRVSRDVRPFISIRLEVHEPMTNPAASTQLRCLDAMPHPR